MGVLRGFLFFCAGVFALGGLLPIYFTGFGLIRVLIAAGGLGLGYVTFKAAQNFGQQNAQQQTLQFEQVARRLADKNGGTVALSAILEATGESKETAQAKMKELTGRGVFELDFGANGEMLFKLSPMDEARANLASMSQTKH